MTLDDDLTELSDDALLEAIETNGKLLDVQKRDLEDNYALRIAMFQEARRRTPPISHARSAAAAGVKTTAAVINARKKAATAANDSTQGGHLD